MRVLMASKFFYLRGGLERVMFDEIAGLEIAGHEVVHFSTRHPLNDPSPWAAHFAPYLEIGHGSALGTRDKVVSVARMYRNRGAARLFGRLLDETHPDVVHVHGIHRQLSPSIVLTAARRGVPVVHTLHDYHLVCPADVMLRGGTSPCLPRACGTFDYSCALRSRCTRGSLAASAIAASELAFQRLTRAYERSVTRFVSPSAFLRDIMVDGGWGSVPIDVLPLGVPLSEADSTTRGDYALYAGRLSPEKGVDIFLSAAQSAGVRAVIAGDGPTATGLRVAFPEAQFLGHVDATRVADLLAGALVAVVPSISLENSPLGVLEAMAAGAPVIATAVGGVPELIGDGVEGLLVPPGDRQALASALSRLAGDHALGTAFGTAGRARARREFTPERHISGLLDVYARAMGGLA